MGGGGVGGGGGTWIALKAINSTEEKGMPSGSGQAADPRLNINHPRERERAAALIIPSAIAKTCWFLFMSWYRGRRELVVEPRGDRTRWLCRATWRQTRWLR